MADVEVLEPTAGVEETQPTAEVPASPDATSPPGGAGEEPAGTGTEPTASGRPRDDKGRFAKQETPEDAPTDAAARGEPTDPVVPAVPETPAPTKPSGDPFTFRAEGQRIPLPGALLSPDGALTVPPDQVPVVRQLLAEGVQYRTSWRQREQEYKTQIEQAGAVEKARADRVEQIAIRMYEALTSPDWLTAAAADPREVNYFVRELGLELERAKLAAPKIETQETVETPPEQIEQAARGTLNEYLEELLESPQAKAVYTTPEQRQAVAKRFQRRLAAYFKADGTEILLHENAVDADFMEELNERVAQKKAADEQARKLADAAAKNAARTTTPQVPSTVPAKGSPTPGEVKKPMDKARWAREHGFA